MSYRVIQNNLEKRKIEEIIERNRRKGGLLHRRIVEKLTYLKPILWPIREFEISYAKKPQEDSTRTFIQKNFMLGKFSQPYIQKMLLDEGGRKALTAIYGKENNRLLNRIGKFTTNVPILPFLDPSVVYTRLFEIYIKRHDELAAELEKVKVDVQPIFDDAESYQQKAEIAKKNAEKHSADKSSPEYKEYIKQVTDFKNQARKLRKEANSKIEEKKSSLDKFDRQWFLGMKNGLRIKKDFKILKFENTNTFYHLYWVGRFESKNGARHLILNEKGRQMKELQNMLLVDEHFRAEIDNLCNFHEERSGIKCYHCGHPITKTQKICSNCKTGILRCSVCKLPISKNQEIGKCPHCENKAHITHLFEWVKTQGKCPVCLQDIKMDSIEDLQN